MQIKLHTNINIKTIYKYFADLLNYNLHHCKFRQTDRQTDSRTYIRTFIQTYLHTYKPTYNTYRQAGRLADIYACMHTYVYLFLSSLLV